MQRRNNGRYYSAVQDVAAEEIMFWIDVGVGGMNMSSCQQQEHFQKTFHCCWIFCILFFSISTKAIFHGTFQGDFCISLPDDTGVSDERTRATRRVHHKAQPVLRSDHKIMQLRSPYVSNRRDGQRHLLGWNRGYK